MLVLVGCKWVVSRLHIRLCLLDTVHRKSTVMRTKQVGSFFKCDYLEIDLKVKGVVCIYQS
jgi:hypothetical protein